MLGPWMNNSLPFKLSLNSYVVIVAFAKKCGPPLVGESPNIGRGQVREIAYARFNASSQMLLSRDAINRGYAGTPVPKCKHFASVAVHTH